MSTGHLADYIKLLKLTSIVVLYEFEAALRCQTAISHAQMVTDSPMRHFHKMCAARTNDVCVNVSIDDTMGN